MTQWKCSNITKAKSVPISLNLKHLNMLRELEFKLKKNRSKVIQFLIEKAYEEETKDLFL